MPGSVRSSSTKMNAIVCFSVALPLGRFPHWRSLSLFLFRAPPCPVAGSTRKEAGGVYLPAGGIRPQWALGPCRMPWHLCTKLVICPLFNRLIQSWGEQGVSGELEVPLGKALRSLGQELSPPSQKKLESISLSPLPWKEQQHGKGRGAGTLLVIGGFALREQGAGEKQLGLHACRGPAQAAPDGDTDPSLPHPLLH